MSIIQEAEELLGKITSWTWEVEQFDAGVDYAVVSKGNLVAMIPLETNPPCCQEYKSNAQFIARSPELVKGLILQVEDLEVELQMELQIAKSIIQQKDAVIAELIAEWVEKPKRGKRQNSVYGNTY